MWLSVVLFFLVGGAFSNSQYGFENEKEYTYKVRSRTFAAVNPQSKQFTGILMEARLTIQSVGKEHLRGKLSQPRYSQVHTRLENGWDSQVPENQINFQNLPMKSQPFEIKTKNSVIRELIVDKDVPTWEVNILKAILSQLQVDIKGENSEKSKQNQFPERGQPYAMFRVMEDSIDGKCEVLYDLSVLPDHMLQNNPELAPMPQLREDGDMISVVKTKNYSNCNQRISYHFGINGRNKWEPGSNENGKYLSRSSVSRVVISGTSKKYTIQSSVTTNQVVLSPDQQDNQQGMVVSKMNITLNEVKTVSEKIPAPVNPESAGNLVYNYNNPSESSSTRRPNKLNSKLKAGSNENSDESSSESSDSTDNEDEDNYFQPKPKLTDAPLNPLLSYFIGNLGGSIQNNGKINAVRAVISISREIGNDLKKPDKMFEENTLEKFTILTRLIRVMNAEQISEVQRDIYENQQSSNQLQKDSEEKSSRRNSWVVFRDAVALAGTGPAIVNIKKWIKSKQLLGFEAEYVIDSMAKSTRTPTPEYMDAFFELVKMEEVKQQAYTRETAILSFADLIRHAIVNKRSAHNRYPVHAFGKFFGRNSRSFQEKYFSYLKEELQSAVESGDSNKIQTYIVALGRTAHPKILSIFEPYIEGKRQVSEYQRLLMIVSLDQLSTIHPKAAQPVLYKIYSNNADAHEIRTAAVYLLMKTHPPASMIQRMADSTNYDTSKHVNSAVKSVIESLAELQQNENRDVSDAAKAALPLLTTENYGPQYSKAFFKNLKNPETNTGLSLAAYYVGSDDSILPRGVSIAINPIIQGLKMPKIQSTGIVSSVRNLIEFTQQQLWNSEDKKSSEKEKEKKFSPESIAKILEIHGFEANQLEGFFVFNENTKNIFMSFDNHSLEQLPIQINQLHGDLKEGMNFDEAKFNNFEVTMSFPTETGLPLTFTLKYPSFMNIKGSAKAEKNENSETVYGKAKVALGLKVQKRIGFVTPFENQEYITGIDKSLQVFLPIKAEIKYNKVQNELSAKLQPADDEPEYKALQYNKLPFTSKHDIPSLRPVTNDKNSHIIHKSHAVPYQIELNDWSEKPSIQFSYERQSNHRVDDRETRESKRQNAASAANKLVRGVAAMIYPVNLEKSEEYEKYSIKITPKNDMSAEMILSYASLRSDNDMNVSSHSVHARAPSLDKNWNSSERKEKFLEEVTKKISSAEGHAIDIDLKLKVGVWSSVSATAAAAMSNVDKKSRAIIHASIKSEGEMDYDIASAIEAKMPNIKSLDYEETLKAENTHMEFDAEVRFGPKDEDEDNENKIKIDGKLKQTEKRKNEIRESHDAQICKKEVKKTGNKMSQACQKVNKRAVSVDAAELTIALHKDLSAKQLAEDLVESVERLSQISAEVPKDREDKEKKNKIKIFIQLSSKDDKADISIKSSDGKVNIKNIKLGHLGHEINSGSSSYSEKQNSELSLMQSRTCSLDKTEVKTFDNSRYLAQIGRCWHVAMTSYPKNDPDQTNKRKDIPDNMRISILTRENGNDQKELKITLGEFELDLKPSESSSRKITVQLNAKKIEISKKRSHQEKKGSRVIIEVFELPDESIKIVSDKYNIHIIYDGIRVEIEAGERYRDSIRGLCGNNDGESDNDQQTPKGCLLQKPEEFIATYALIKNEHCQGPALQNAEKAKMSQCTYENPRPGNVISEQEAGRRPEKSSWEKQDDESEKQCMKHRTKVQKNDDQICFSKRPVPVCSSQCSPAEMKLKKIEYHCVQKTETSEKIADRVEKGANPDLMQKSTTKTEFHQTPISCKP